MSRLSVIPDEKGWKVTGTKGINLYKTKETAVRFARVIARSAQRPLVIYSKDGRIISVNSYSTGFANGRILSANVKHTLDGNKVRVSIIEAMNEAQKKRSNSKKTVRKRKK